MLKEKVIFKQVGLNDMVLKIDLTEKDNPILVLENEGKEYILTLDDCYLDKDEASERKIVFFMELKTLLVNLGYPQGSLIPIMNKVLDEFHSYNPNKSAGVFVVVGHSRGYLYYSYALSHEGLINDLRYLNKLITEKHIKAEPRVFSINGDTSLLSNKDYGKAIPAAKLANILEAILNSDDEINRTSERDILMGYDIFKGYQEYCRVKENKFELVSISMENNIESNRKVELDCPELILVDIQAGMDKGFSSVFNKNLVDTLPKAGYRLITQKGRDYYALLDTSVIRGLSTMTQSIVDIHNTLNVEGYEKLKEVSSDYFITKQII